MPLINGTATNDNLTGTDLSDDINGFAGDDFIEARNGDDVIHGGDGNDTIYAGAGGPFAAIDWIHDEAGDDVVFGGEDMDIIYASAGNDFYDGGTGTTGIFGLDLDCVRYENALAGITIDLRVATGQVRSVGGADAAGIGVDTLVNIEEIYGSNFDDSMRAADGFAGNAALYGGAGNDTLIGGSSNDVLGGGQGDDLIDGGTGRDLVTYRFASGGVNVHLGSSSAQPTNEGTTRSFQSRTSGVAITTTCFWGTITAIGSSASTETTSSPEMADWTFWKVAWGMTSTTSGPPTSMPLLRLPISAALTRSASLLGLPAHLYCLRPTRASNAWKSPWAQAWTAFLGGSTGQTSKLALLAIRWRLRETKAPTPCGELPSMMRSTGVEATID